eukprot:g79458.t1
MQNWNGPAAHLAYYCLFAPRSLRSYSERSAWLLMSTRSRRSAEKVASTESKDESRSLSPPDSSSNATTSPQTSNGDPLADSRNPPPIRKVKSYQDVMKSLPKEFTKLSTFNALRRLGMSLYFSILSFHALTVCPRWAIPLCWLFAGASLLFVFEIAHDCAAERFFPTPWANHLLGTLYMSMVLQPYSFWRRTIKLNKENRDTRVGPDMLYSFWWPWMLSKEGDDEPETSSLSYAFVLMMAFVVFPSLAWRMGWEDFVKIVVMPAVCFNICLVLCIKLGDPVLPPPGDDKGCFKATPGFLENWKLRSYLQFYSDVPAYNRGQAVDVSKRMISRAYADTSDGDVEAGIRELIENPQFSAIWDGYKTLEFSSMAIPLLTLWTYSAWSSGTDTLRRLVYLAMDASTRDWIKETFTVDNLTKLCSTNNFIILTAIIVVLIFTRKVNRKRQVYLLDFITYSPPPECQISTEAFRKMQRVMDFSEDSLSFMDKLSERTGLGDETYFPHSIMQALRTGKKPSLNLKAAREEAEMVLYGSMDKLFATTHIKPEEIDILVVNCSLFCPTPSLASMIVNKYKLRSDIQSYNLGGMGCSAGVIAIHLAKDLLQSYKNCNAVVVSTENLTQNWYQGQEKGMLISNTLFRCGGAAILLSNKWSSRRRAKYRLLHSIRTHMGADDKSYNAVYQDIDQEGLTGVRLSKELMGVAGKALRVNISTLGPSILPWSEQIKFFVNLFNRKVRKKDVKPYVPNFQKAISHFCIHAGGRAVIEAIESALQLDQKHLEASKAVLRRFGNTSSSSIWYELGYLEKHGLIKRGEKVWQIAFGSGFKCNSAVWEAL